VFADDVKNVVCRHVEGIDQCVVDGFRDMVFYGGGFALSKGNTDERHGGSPFES
jgi:hypothetical protein